MTLDHIKTKEKLLRLMERDLIHGSSWYFDKTIELLELSKFEDLKKIQETISVIRPMGSLSNIVEILTKVKNENELKKIILNLKEYRKKAMKDLTDMFLNLDFQSFITISFSSAVFSMVKIVKPGNIYLMESKPGFEAKYAFKEYSKYSNVKIIPDSTICKFMEESEVIVFGADGIYSDGFIVNKIGSRSLVACGSMLKVPIYVISESYKASKVCPCNLKVIDYEIFGHSTRIPLFEKLELEKINFLVTNVGIYPNPKSADIINIHNHFIQSVIKNII